MRQAPLRQKIHQQAEAAIRTHLRKLKKEDLVELALRQARRNRDSWDELVAESEFQPQFASPAERVDAARLAISEATDEEHEYGGDYDAVKQHLQTLLKAGHADEVLELGALLYRLGERQVEMSDEGLMCHDIDDCLRVVFAALPKSSLSPGWQLIWAWELAAEDGYCICDKTNKKFWGRKHSKAAWSEFADALQQRLADFDAAAVHNGKGRKKRPSPYESQIRARERNRLVDSLNHALHQAGRESETVSSS